MDDLITDVRDQLLKLGVAPTIRHRADKPPLDDAPTPAEVFEVELRRGPARGTYTVLCGRGIRPRDTTLMHYEGRRDALVWTDHISPQTAESFRDLGVQFVDAAGNAWLEFDNAVIDVRGQKPARRSTTTHPATSNLFSPNRSRVIFVLLAWPHLYAATQQQIATAANVSVGLTNGTLKMLHQEGYDRSSTSRSRLLDRWTDAYPLGLGKSLDLGRFRSEAARPHLDVHVRTPAFLSGESAIPDQLKPITLTLYVPSLEKSLIGLNRWRTDRTPNVFVRQQFWKSPDDVEIEPGVQVAPWPLVYADLFTSDDPRVRNAAKEWRARAERAAGV